MKLKVIDLKFAIGKLANNNIGHIDSATPQKRLLSFYSSKHFNKRSVVSIDVTSDVALRISKLVP